MHQYLESVRELKRIRRQGLILNVKFIISAYNVFNSTMRLKNKYPEIYKEYLVTKEEFWNKVNDSKLNIKRVLIEEYRDFKFHIKFKYWMLTRRRK